MSELVKASQENRLLEAFGAGTAAVINPVNKIIYKDHPSALFLDTPKDKEKRNTPTAWSHEVRNLAMPCAIKTGAMANGPTVKSSTTYEGTRRKKITSHRKKISTKDFTNSEQFCQKNKNYLLKNESKSIHQNHQDVPLLDRSYHYDQLGTGKSGTSSFRSKAQKNNRIKASKCHLHSF